MDKQLITIIDELGNKKDVEVVSIFPAEREDKIYIAYSDGTIDDNDMVNIYFSILNEENNELSIKAIETNEELQYVSNLLMKQLEEGK